MYWAIFFLFALTCSFPVHFIIHFSHIVNLQCFLLQSSNIPVPFVFYFLLDPFPAFKSWQEDNESGEAQLSPQAGRMNHPLEEDSHPILAHRSLDFGQSQRFLHDAEKIDSSSKALSFVR